MEALIKQVSENKQLVDFRLIDGTEDLEYFTEEGYITRSEVEQAENGNWYIKGYVPELTQQEKENKVRYIRDLYINDIEWRETRYKDQVELQIPTDDTPEEYNLILLYKQYLRDYTKKENWWENNPLTYEEFKKNL